MSHGRDAAFADLAAQGPGDALPFYEIEGQILELWDQLNELRLEKALLEAQDTVPTVQQPSTDEELNAQLKIAEKECLEARATYSLKQNVVEDVLIVDPVLKAVHSGLNATPTERALHPLVDRRDTLEISHTNLSSTLQILSKEAAMLSADNIRAMEKNRALTATLVALAKKVQAQRDEVTKDLRFSAQLDGLRNDAGTVMQRWRIMKSVVAAVIAGSGVDWARDDALRDLVLDEEDEAD
ncbi:MAG: hypothetical protein ASARMPREDX12_003774 [Alectoria sarmentosa]|nr:MAG: hypothetical protein ASARMPREDX12_003774 [Alectoria sarmentosa]